MCSAAARRFLAAIRDVPLTLNYDNAFAADNVYGHAVELLARLGTPGPTIHLDLGCGFGRIAEPLVEATGRIYVGVDGDGDGLASLSLRGFETHLAQFGDRATNLEIIKNILGGRQLGSLSIIDTLEHLVDPFATLAVLRDIAGEFSVPLVVSVPNVAHRDIAIRLLFGRFEYTKAGLLDHTHLQYFTVDRMLRMAGASGWHEVAENDVKIEESDQHFPIDHVALAPGSVLNRFLHRLRDRPDDSANINQIVRCFLPGPVGTWSGWLPPPPDTQNFLTVIVPTAGDRPEALRDCFAGLMGQSDRDFEVIVAGHRFDHPRLLLVERIIEDSPAWLRDRTRLVKNDQHPVSAAINAALDSVNGRYFSILADDTVAVANWVETFRDLAMAAPGAVLRGRSWVQAFRDVVMPESLPSAFAVSAPAIPDDLGFDLVTQLCCPEVLERNVAFPSSILRDLRFRLDDGPPGPGLSEFFVAAAAFCGVESSTEITAVLRDEVSRTSVSGLLGRVEASALPAVSKRRCRAAIAPRGICSAIAVARGGCARVAKCRHDRGRLSGIERQIRDGRGRGAPTPGSRY